MGCIEQPDETTNDQPSTLTRRSFFGLSWRVLSAFALGQAGCIGLRFLASRKAEGVAGEIVTAGLVNDFPVGTITPFEQARFFLIRFEDGGFLALNSRCPHLACAVGWNAAQNRFNCPCHGSEFARDGRVLNPPAPRPLDRFEVIIEETRLKVDTRYAIQRTETTPDVLVYAPDLAPSVDGTPTDLNTPTPTFTPPDR